MRQRIAGHRRSGALHGDHRRSVSFGGTGSPPLSKRFGIEWRAIATVQADSTAGRITPSADRSSSIQQANRLIYNPNRMQKCGRFTIFVRWELGALPVNEGDATVKTLRRDDVPMGESTRACRPRQAGDDQDAGSSGARRGKARGGNARRSVQRGFQTAMQVPAPAGRGDDDAPAASKDPVRGALGQRR